MTHPEPLLARLRGGEAPTTDAAERFRDAALSDLTGERERIEKLADFVHDAIAEPQDGDREKAWQMFRLIDAGYAQHSAAQLYLLLDPDQQRAVGRVGSPESFGASVWTHEVDVPADYVSSHLAETLRVTCDPDGTWVVTRRYKHASGLASWHRSPVLRSALTEAAGAYGSGQAWAIAAERIVIAAALAWTPPEELS